MPSSDTHRRLALALATLVTGLWTTRAEAQATQPIPLQPAQGFAVERFYPSAAGAGWFVMDDLDLHGGFGGAISLTTGYGRLPLNITSADGTKHLGVVTDQAFADFAATATYDRFRAYLNFYTPLHIAGQSGTIGGYQFTGPQVDLGSNPDTLADARIGVDVRILGKPGDPLRLGVGAQLLIPSGNRSDYDTDATFRGMFRLLFAGDAGRWIYAGQLGVHLRPLDETPVPDSPRGSELLFGIAAGPKFPVGNNWAFIVGPEIFGETAFNSFFGGSTTGVEGLLTTRFEGTGTSNQARFKLGVGAGLDPNFGTPEWRIVLAVELFGQKPPAQPEPASSPVHPEPASPSTGSGQVSGPDSKDAASEPR